MNARKRLATLSLVSVLLGALAVCMVSPRKPRRDWGSIDSFAYQLQDLRLPEVANSSFDLVICDPTARGDEASRWTAEQVAQLQRKPDGSRRYLLAYLSIGEAEEYRAYWKAGFRPGSPRWLLRPNPAWPDNHTVAYWDPDWQSLVLEAADKVLAAGFDGIYLDIVDAYERFPERPDAREQMCRFVARIASHVRAKAGPDFGVFAQNGEELLDNPAYAHALTGLGREDTYFGNPGDSQASPAGWTLGIEQRLDRARASGKLILSIDYTDRRSQKAQARSRARAKGYLEYVARRELDTLESQSAP